MKNINIPVAQGDILFGIYQKKASTDDKKYGINVARVVEITLTFTQETHIYLDNGIVLPLTDLPNYFYLTYDEAKMALDQLNHEGGDPLPEEDDLEDHFDEDAPPMNTEPAAQEEDTETTDIMPEPISVEEINE